MSTQNVKKINSNTSNKCPMATISFLLCRKLLKKIQISIPIPWNRTRHIQNAIILTAKCDLRQKTTYIKINGLKCGQKMSKSTAVLHLQYEPWEFYFTNRQLCYNMKDTSHTDKTPITMESSPSKAFILFAKLDQIQQLLGQQ